MSSARNCLGACALILASAIASPASFAQNAKPAGNDGAVLVWHDEFNGPDGTLPGTDKWDAVVNDSGYGNNELEYYTRRPANLHLQQGHLVLTARKEHFTGPDGQTRAFTSARIETRGKFNVKYGRIEARIKLPAGQGLWPAFWLLGQDFSSIGWPACGEIDIMENVGFEPATIHGSLHGPGYSGANPLTGITTLGNHAPFSQAFHVFAVEWEPEQIRFYVDGRLFETQRKQDLAPGKRWVFDHPFYIVLNLAVGGYWPGNPDATTTFPATMLVDYVRVYKLNAAPAPLTSAENSSPAASK